MQRGELVVQLIWLGIKKGHIKVTFFEIGVTGIEL